MGRGVGWEEKKTLGKGGRVCRRRRERVRCRREGCRREEGVGGRTRVLNKRGGKRDDEEIRECCRKRRGRGY